MAAAAVGCGEGRRSTPRVVRPVEARWRVRRVVNGQTSVLSKVARRSKLRLAPEKGERAVMNSTRGRWLGVLSLAVVVSTVAPIAVAAQQSTVDLKAFVGRWTENPAMSRVTMSKELTYTFNEEPDGFITIVRERVQLRDRVRFDGNDYATPDIEGRTTSWTRVSETVYQTTIKNDGVLTARGRWTLSDDGRRLTQETTRAEPQAATNIIEYIRTSGPGNSLLGVWSPCHRSPRCPSHLS